MLVLGIETSCDDTGVALYESNAGLLANICSSQLLIHQNYGGVVPELASRDHAKKLSCLIKQVFLESQVSRKEVDVVAYTKGPGLVGSLLVGAAVAHGLSLSLNKPVLGIHHLEGHILSPLLSFPELAFPFLALVVSGGHTQIVQANSVGNYLLLGETLDDAAGEAFDKTAKMLGLDYPGGPILSQLARDGDDKRFTLPLPLHGKNGFNFSFSGLKTAANRLINQQVPLSKKDIADIAACFQQAVVSILIHKTKLAIKKTKLPRLIIGGGVAANEKLRQAIDQLALDEKISAFYPATRFCTDNGAMIALAGAMRANQKPKGKITKKCYSFEVKPRWPLTDIDS